MHIRTICIISFPFIALLYNISAQHTEDIDAPPNRGYDPLNDPLSEELPGVKITLQDKKGAEAQMNRFTIPTTTMKMFYKPTYVVSFPEDCDYLAHFCLKSYLTGKVCGRTIYYSSYTFKNYCLLEYVNCMERYELWQVAYMGECFDVKLATDFNLYRYEDDYFLDEYYIFEDH